jgi:hypothetical protein
MKAVTPKYHFTASKNFGWSPMLVGSIASTPKKIYIRTYNHNLWNTRTDMYTTSHLYCTYTTFTFLNVQLPAPCTSSRTLSRTCFAISGGASLFPAAAEYVLEEGVVAAVRTRGEVAVAAAIEHGQVEQN